MFGNVKIINLDLYFYNKCLFSKMRYTVLQSTVYCKKNQKMFIKLKYFLFSQIQIKL